MKNKRFISIRVKITVVYFLLTLINISMLTIIIMDNQVELIAENINLNARETIANINSSLKKFTAGFNQHSVTKTDDNMDQVRLISSIIRPLVPRFMILTERGEVLEQHGDGITIPDDFVEKAVKAITIMGFSGVDYISDVKTTSSSINFYIPMDNYGLEDSILFIQYEMKSVDKRFTNLYRSIMLMIITVALLHFFFGLFLFKTIIKPITEILAASNKIAGGDYTVTVDLERNDEIGRLAGGFNHMAGEIKNRINLLNTQMEIISNAKKRMEELATVDQLTGLYNRRHLFSRLDTEIETYIRYHNTLSVIMIDIDHFKQINDHFGHKAGDNALRDIADTFKNNCRRGDIISRHGGEEFLIILPNTDLSGAVSVAEKIRKAADSVKIDTGDSKSVSLAVSCGVANISQVAAAGREDMAEKLIAASDWALYRSKEEGRNRVTVYTPEDQR